MLEKHRWRDEIFWEIQRGRKKVAHGHIKAFRRVMRSYGLPHLGVGEFAHGKRCRLKHTTQIRHGLDYRAAVESRGIDRLCSR